MGKSFKRDFEDDFDDVDVRSQRQKFNKRKHDRREKRTVDDRVEATAYEYD